MAYITINKDQCAQKWRFSAKVAFLELLVAPKKIWGALKNQEKPSKKAFSSKYIEKSLEILDFGYLEKIIR